MAVFTNIEGKGTPKKGVSLRRMFEQLNESNKYSQFFYEFTEVEVGVFDLRIYFDLFGEDALRVLGQLDADLRPHFDQWVSPVTGDCRALEVLKVDIPSHWTNSLIKRPSKE